MTHTSPVEPGKVKVLVVDDSYFMRKVISDLLDSDPDIEAVGQAADGVEALELIEKLQPDVITLDLIMPKMNGFAILEKLDMTKDPPAIIMVSAYTSSDTGIVLDCLSMGAADFVLKPSESNSDKIKEIRKELCIKVKNAADARAKHKTYASHSAITEEVAHNCSVLVIGSSTGGPLALGELLPRLPGTLPYPVLVAQHMPAQFVESLTERLDQSSQLKIRTGRDGDVVMPGFIYFAPGGAHTEVVKNSAGQVVLKVTESSDTLTPSVDKLMESVARVYGDTALAVILTGMGDDGLSGMAAIKAAGGHTLVQDAQSSVVYGMGRVVAEGGFADEVLSLNQIGLRIR